MNEALAGARSMFTLKGAGILLVIYIALVALERFQDGKYSPSKVQF